MLIGSQLSIVSKINQTTLKPSVGAFALRGITCCCNDDDDDDDDDNDYNDNIDYDNNGNVGIGGDV